MNNDLESHFASARIVQEENEKKYAVLLLTLTILSTHDVRLRKQICFLRCQPVGHILYVSDRMTL